MIYIYSTGVWFIILVGAVLNGALRDKVVAPKIGFIPAHMLSCFLLSFIVLVITYFFIKNISVQPISKLWLIGVQWIIMTLCFEFLFGHYVLGKSFNVLLEDYNILAGRLWILVLITTFFAPYLIGKYLNRTL